MTWLLDRRLIDAGRLAACEDFQVVFQLEEMVLRYWEKCGKETKGNPWAPKRGEPC